MLEINEELFKSRGKYAGEPNWQKESERTMFKTLDEAEAFMKSMVGKDYEGR